MELDKLYSYIASATVVADFSALARRIANKQLPHGADIVIGIHTRLLNDSRPLWMRPPPPRRSIPEPPEPVEVGESDHETLEDEDEDETGPFRGGSLPTPSRALGGSLIPNVPPQAPAAMPAPFGQAPKKGKGKMQEKWSSQAAVKSVSFSLGQPAAEVEEPRG